MAISKRRNETENVIGLHGAITRNINERILILNTFFALGQIKKIVKSCNEKSTTDYILINRNHKNDIQDVKVTQGPEINSDHSL